VEQVGRLLVLNEGMASLDAPLDVDPLLSVGESLADQSSLSPDLSLQHSEVQGHMHEWLDRLSERQRSVLERRYGLNGHDIHTLEQLAEDLGLTRERVRQIQLEALATLRRILQEEGVAREAVL
jgi:RNA polymerase nonessential primary-like sigma factor